ncbi:hypothetical protein MMC07_002495 [Pseudocyphellaria aurata]|nr:hypothetical protein [Pseudocyphellaria aurata]
MPRRGRVKRADEAKGTKNTSSPTVLPDVYTVMLKDTVSSSTRVDEEERTIKKRRIAGRVVLQDTHDREAFQPNPLSKVPDQIGVDSLDAELILSQPQTVYNDSEDSADSDMDWEEVDLAHTIVQEDSPERDSEPKSELNLVLGNDHGEAQRSTPVKRKPVSKAEKQVRLEIHKMHLLCLLYYVHLRNHWCNDKEVHVTLKSLLSTRTISYLNPDEKLSQFQRTRSFTDGLDQASKAFRQQFRVNARGMSRPYWAESPVALNSFSLPEDLELPMQKFDFRDAAKSLEASRDTGAQLFCALLRSANVEARLVCSLQPLPFLATLSTTNSQRATRKIVVVDSERQAATSSDESEIDSEGKGPMEVSNSIGSMAGRSRLSLGPSQRLGISSQNQKIKPSNRTTTYLKKSRRKRIRESPFPLFWVEAFDEANQKWIPVDPLTITNSISKPSKFEPPASDSQNKLSYVLAFGDDGSARDVTKRYAKAFNAKTRKSRVEVTNGGENWWKRVLKIYKRTYDLSRDQIEDSSLAAREAAEPMPNSISDFKDHPYYALERHLKRGEVVHPKREAGKVAVGRSGGQQILEPIFRRRDVHVVKSAESWFRMGREVRTGEQPLKHVPARRKNEAALDDDDLQSASEAIPGVPLYAAYQTSLYCSPPVVNGIVPKNQYGNLDVYVPSMVPAGGTHISHPETARAARILGIEYTQAVTGFEFKGRHGTAVICGAVVASEYCQAVKEVIEGFDDEKLQEEEVRRSVQALKAWKSMLTRLKIRARVEGYEIEGERKFADDGIGRNIDNEDESDSNDDEQSEDDYNDDELGGGFFPGTAEAHAEPTAGSVDRFRGQEGSNEGGFLAEDSMKDSEGGFEEADVHSPRGLHGEKDLADYDEAAGGGFMVDDESDENNDGSRGVGPTIDRYFPAQGNLLDNFAEQLTPRTEELTTLNGGKGERDGGGFISKDDLSTATMLPHISSANSHHNTTTPHEGEEQEISAEGGTATHPTTIELYNEGKTRDDLTGPAAAASKSVNSRSEEERKGAQLSASSPKAPPSPSADPHPPSSPHNDESMIPHQQTTAQDHHDAPDAATTGGDAWNETSDDDEDAESLLSQDPEDADADPEWLA